MDVFEGMMQQDHEQIVFGYDADAGLKAIIAIHNTVLGPAAGGTRMWPYASEGEALRDVLQLSRGMTYKAAAAGLNLGGGKAVIIGDPDKDKNEILFRAFGRLVEGLHGRYITAEDVGTTVEDMEWVRSETTYVGGISEALGGSGDPSPLTARGVYCGMQAAVEHKLKTSSMRGLTVAIQGLGHVGWHLAEILYGRGVNLIVSDLHDDRLRAAREKFEANVLEKDEIYTADAEIFAPCALGGILNDETIPEMRFKIIAGAANNQLEASERHSKMLKERGILYAPDYLINAGGLINVASEIEGYNRDRAMKQVETIYSVLKDVFRLAAAEDIPVNMASNEIARARIRRIRRLRRRFLAPPAVTLREARMFH